LLHGRYRRFLWPKRYHSLTLSHKLCVLFHKSLKDISPSIGYHSKEKLRLVYTYAQYDRELLEPDTDIGESDFRKVSVRIVQLEVGFYENVSKQHKEYWLVCGLVSSVSTVLKTKVSYDKTNLLRFEFKFKFSKLYWWIRKHFRLNIKYFSRIWAQWTVDWSHIWLSVNDGCWRVSGIHMSLLDKNRPYVFFLKYSYALLLVCFITLTGFPWCFLLFVKVSHVTVGATILFLRFVRFHFPLYVLTSFVWLSLWTITQLQ